MLASSSRPRVDTPDTKFSMALDHLKSNGFIEFRKMPTNRSIETWPFKFGEEEFKYLEELLLLHEWAVRSETVRKTSSSFRYTFIEGNLFPMLPVILCEISADIPYHASCYLSTNP